ncbi:hypothetical protein ACQKJC_24730 [Priestia koreensis]|uniref:hypothetical protein n=1 Tax=Priestia koreensis TaxID=284581 RepID=UPI003CFDB503
MKFVLEKKEVETAIAEYVQNTYGEGMNPFAFHFCNGERFVPVKHVEVLMKDQQVTGEGK